MENVLEFLQQAFAAILFCAGITLFCIGYASYEDALVSAKIILQEDVMYEQYSESEECVVAKGELMATLLHPLEYDIEIDGYLISKYDSTKADMVDYDIVNDHYIKTYAYDTNGKVTRIIYTGK